MKMPVTSTQSINFMKPFLKWAGNKYKIVDKIKALLAEINYPAEGLLTL